MSLELKKINKEKMRGRNGDPGSRKVAFKTLNKSLSEGRKMFRDT